MISKGYLTGHDDGFLRPEGILSRAQGATLLTRVIDPLNSTGSGGSSNSGSHSSVPTSTAPPAPMPENTDPTPSHIRHLGNLILLKTNGAGSVTTFQIEEKSAQAEIDSDALIASFWISNTSSGIETEGIAYEDHTGQLITAEPDALVYEAMLSASGTFESYRKSDQSEITIGDRIYLYNTRPEAGMDDKANLILYHRVLDANYGVVLTFINEMSIEEVPYPAKIKFKTATGEIKNFAFVSSSSVVGADVTDEEAFGLYQLIRYQLDANGRITQVTADAIQAASKYTSLQLSGADQMLAVEIGPFPNTTLDVAITVSSIAMAVVVDQNSISVVDMEELSASGIALDVADTSFILQDNVLQAMVIQSSGSIWEGTDWIFGKDRELFEIDKVAGIMTIGAVQYTGFDPVTLTVAAINANSTVFTGEDEEEYTLDADAIVYVPQFNLLGEVTGYDVESLFYVLPGDVLTLYYIQHNTDSTTGPYNIAVQCH